MSDWIDRNKLIDILEAEEIEFNRLGQEAFVPSDKTHYFGEACGVYRAIVRVEQCDAIDAVEVVRCKDCMWYGNDELDKPHWCQFHGRMTLNDDFCSDGEKRKCQST